MKEVAESNRVHLVKPIGDEQTRLKPDPATGCVLRCSGRLRRLVPLISTLKLNPFGSISLITIIQTQTRQPKSGAVCSFSGSEMPTPLLAWENSAMKSGTARLVVVALLISFCLLALPVSLPAQFMIIQPVGFQANSFTLSFSSATGQVYVVQYANDLTPPATWHSLAAVNGDGSVRSFIDTGATPPHRYYRLKSFDNNNIGLPFYSLNVIGYVRCIIQPGTNFVANPLPSSSGYSIGSLFPNCPEGSQVLVPVPDGSGSLALGSVFSGGIWNPSNLNLFPGQGVGFLNPSSPFELTFVGEVPQGGLTNPLPAGLSLRSSIATVNGLLNFPARQGDIIQTWNATNQTYDTHNYTGGAGWSTAPAIRPGEAFWVRVSEYTNWVQSFDGVGFEAPEAPVITSQPQSLTLTQGAAAHFTALIAIGRLPLTYQWRFNGVSQTDNFRITGSQSNVLSIANLQFSDAGNYDVVVTNSLGSVTSAVAALVVRAVYPNIVAGFNPLAYWRFDETSPSPALNAVTNASSLGSILNGYIVADATLGEAGRER
jgi:hypothetical protein